ncbi:S8 family peptidase [Chryseobacterium profundimaris]|uniref:Subtilase family protein n=1 Tax=Chryseobacterium profundimaris TaxID=1387275 RepID=A0ABY1NRV5_9FLAO|nr:S8 family peptidase [Chryseobacterium profundimaris]SMP16364.1 Subtilase family protein [Chryseobacterium profundimaris]
MEKFPHLQFFQKVSGKPRLNGGPNYNPITEGNKRNRGRHSRNLLNKTTQLKTDWNNELSVRQQNGLAPLDADIIPIFLKVNPKLVNTDFDLKQFGIEIISEEDNGYIIGASLDGFFSLEEKINKFFNDKRGGGQIAEFWEIIDGNQWKPEHILSDYLKSIWQSVDENTTYRLEVGVAFDKPLSKVPDQYKRGYALKLEKHRQNLIERDNRFLERQDEFEDFINYYGNITSEIIDLEDSFCCEVEITGKGLKDLVLNYPFVFEVSEVDEIEGVQAESEETESFEIEVIEPEENAPEIGVIDSGIMERNKYISSAIISENSKSYIRGDVSTADHVKSGGHGTRVAGAILYPYGISTVSSPYQLPCYIRNLRILNQDNKLTDKFPAQLMQEIITDNQDCRVFNLSVNSCLPARIKHMSSWAATIDKLINEKDILFLISAGNIPISDKKGFGIINYIKEGKNYPDYLNEPFCRIANPAQSSFAITVGSVNHISFNDEDFESIGNKNDISPFSRIGTGIWGMIKPDIVEYGGGLSISRVGSVVSVKNELSPELVRSTLHGGPAIGTDIVGTSFATPKVSYIVAQLLKLYPEENINLLRGLLVQGARLPEPFFENPSAISIKRFGYGIPSLERVTKNNDQRITFYNTGNIRAEEGHIYSLKIPEFLSSPAEEYDVLIEVTVSYTAKVRRTRQKTKSYLSSWLDWTSSKVGELFGGFKDYVLKEIEGKVTTYDKEVRNAMPSWNWKIKGDMRGEVDGINRTNSTVQKDWAIIKSHELPEDINFAIRGHKGWDKSNGEIPYSLIVSIEILNSSLEIYEAIRIENEIENLV